ncbi:DGAT2B [Scenedesmus sp. PABB004]|nr:DGAT2B [Scenedesmus sp. PABB004]
MASALRSLPGPGALRALLDGAVWRQKVSDDLAQRLLLWVFGCTVIAQLWLWPIFAVLAAQSATACVLLASYLAWVLWGPGRRARYSEAPWHAPWRHLPVWRHMGDYLSARLIKTAELDPRGRYVFAAYPHGVSAISGWVSFATEAAGFSRLFPGLRPWCMTLASNFKCPLIREYCLLYGLRSCEAAACRAMLAAPGSAIVIFPGGAAEALVTEQGRFNVVRRGGGGWGSRSAAVLKRRKGFARVALQTGASLVPVFAFGETDLFETYVPPPGSLLSRLQRLSHRYWGTSQPLFRGAGIFADSGLLPLRRPLTTVVGAPIPVPARLDPAVVGQAAFDAAVDDLHAAYVAALTGLFDAWKEQLAPHRRGELNIVA